MQKTPTANAQSPQVAHRLRFDEAFNAITRKHKTGSRRARRLAARVASKNVSRVERGVPEIVSRKNERINKQLHTIV